LVLEDISDPLLVIGISAKFHISASLILLLKSKQETFEPKLPIEFYCLAVYGSSLEVATYMI